ncbi:FkbM family methyltransferase [Pseudomonas sp. 18175]|uniref:FkbM family methyltransferase n=1 Tax=Pseudomonas sp. 18175 TaxID=3390056 RepID=UPI003D23B5B0
MTDVLVAIYRWAFGRLFFRRLNNLLHRCSLAGLGILNYKNPKISGEYSFLRKYISPKTSPVVIDVGANTGGYAKLLRSLNSSAIIHAFEPHPKTFSVLLKEFGDTEGIYLNNSAVGHEPGVLTLYDYSANDGSEHASLYKEVIESIHKSDAIEHRVPVVTVSEYCNLAAIDRIDLLKIDTEGHELAVILGAAEIINERRIQAIHFEFNEMNVISRTYLRDFINALPNYKLYRLLPGGMLSLMGCSALHSEIFAYQNIVALLDE